MKDTTIRSCEPIEEGSLERLGAYALRKGQSTYGLKKQLEKSLHILGSTQTEYEDSASHPSVVMPSVWDFGGVNTNVPGVYKVTVTARTFRTLTQAKRRSPMCPP